MGKTNRLFRLRDIVVGEVSIVDRAANKRRFIIRKQSETDAGPVLVDIESEGINPSPGGENLRKALEALVSAAKSFEAETAPLAVIPGELLDEVRELSTRLSDTSRGPSPSDGKDHMEKEEGKEQVQEEADKAGGALEAKVREAVERLTSLANAMKDAGEAGFDQAKFTAEIKAVGDLLAGIGEKYPYPTTKRDNAWSRVLREVSTRAMALSNKVTKQPIDRRGIVEIKRFVEMMSKLLTKAPKPQIKDEEGAIDALFERASDGDLDSFDTILEIEDAVEASTAVTQLASEVEACEKKLDEAEKNAPPAPEPDSVTKLAEIVAKQQGENKALVDELKALRTQLTKSLETPADRASKQDPPAPVEGGDADPTLFPLNYNDPQARAAYEAKHGQI